MYFVEPGYKRKASDYVMIMVQTPLNIPKIILSYNSSSVCCPAAWPGGESRPWRKHSLPIVQFIFTAHKVNIYRFQFFKLIQFYYCKFCADELLVTAMHRSVDQRQHTRERALEEELFYFFNSAFSFLRVSGYSFIVNAFW